MRIIIAILMLASVLAVRAQEFSTTGLLRSITPTRIEFLEQQASGDPGRVSTAIVTPQTSIENCTLDAVRKGAVVALTLETDSAGTSTATRIYFFTCRESAAFGGTVVGRNGDAVIVRNATWDAPFRRNTDVAVTFMPTAQIVACTNMPLDPATLEVGRTVVVNGEVGEDGASVVAAYLSTTDDCPITTYTNGVVEARTDTSLILDTDLAGRIEALAPLSGDGSGRRDPDILGVTSCTGEPLYWRDIVAGDTVQVLVTLYADGRADLGGVTVLSGCVTDPVLGRLEGVNGTLLVASDDSVVVRTDRGRDVTVFLGDATFVGDCSGRPIVLSDIDLGATVAVSGRRLGGVLTATYVFDLTTCTAVSIYAVIEGADATAMTIRTETGRTTTVVIDENTRIADCSGRDRNPLDERLREKTARIVLDVASDPPLVRTIDVDVDCPAIVYTSGTIAEVNDSIVRIDTMGLEVNLERATTYLTDGEGVNVAWDDLRTGQSVCMQYGYLPTLPNAPIRAVVIVGQDCLGEPGSVPLVAAGVVVSNNGDRMTVRSKGEDLDFALNENSNVTGAPTIAAIAEGASVRITSYERLRSLQPVASMIEVRTTTSVDEDEQRDAASHVHPNPATDIITVLGDNVVETALLDLDGRLLVTGTTGTIDVTRIPTGVYVVRSRTAAGDTRTSMVVVSR